MAFLRDMDFGNEAGEDASLSETALYFVEQEDFDRYLKLKNKLLIARAKKGVGKSALLEWLYISYKDADDVFVVKVKGSDLVNFSLPNLSNSNRPNDRIYNWMSRMAAVVNREIGRKIEFALSDDDITLVQTSEIDGFKERNLFSALADRFRKAIEKIGVANEKITITENIKILSRTQRTILLLIDDVDATFQNTQEEKLELSTLFSACRSLINKVEGLSIRITIRADVWPIVRKYDESLDKVEQYIHDIQWSEEDFTKILVKRIKNSLELPETESTRSTLQHIYSSDSEWGNKIQSAHRPIYTLSYKRPRWGIQLSKLSQSAALKDRKPLIDVPSIDDSLVTYGLRRIDDIVVEHQHQCSSIKEIILSFRRSKSKLNHNELLTYIKAHVTNHISVIIDGNQTINPSDVAEFLYRVGFIVARIDGSQEYQHISYDEVPDFISKKVDAGASEITWEIHPCYRQALDIESIGKAKSRAREMRL